MKFEIKVFYFLFKDLLRTTFRTTSMTMEFSGIRDREEIETEVLRDRTLASKEIAEEEIVRLPEY
jgi:hypothetical protein